MVTRLAKSERGVALLAVLLGVALMTLIVVDFAMTSGLGYVSAANQANELRAGYLARSGVGVGLGLLAASARAQQQMTAPVDTLNDPWAAPFPPMPVGGGTVGLSIVDEDRKLGINEMVSRTGGPNPLAIAKIQRLFTILNVNTDLIQGIIQWITPLNGGLAGNSADFYMGLKPPYQPRYGPMPTIGDLQMVQGFNESIFNRVSPFLTPMPVSVVNANTATPQVLAALEPELMEDQRLVEDIVDTRAIQPFTATTDVMNMPDLSTVAQRLGTDITVHSTYFTINGTGTYAGARKFIAATFRRENSGIGTLGAWHEE